MQKLTFTRFIAALAVVFTHFGQGMPVIDAAPWVYFARQGSFMVSYFFVLSGFIMGAVYWDLAGREARRGYWVARFARIYPVYLLALIFMASLGNAPVNERPVVAFALNAFLLQSWVPAYAMTGNPPGWSLSTEAFFYAVFPFILPAFRRWPLSRVALVVGTLWVVSQVGYHVALAVLTPAPESLLHNALHYQPALHLNSFLVGVLASLLVARCARRSASACATGYRRWPFLLVLASSAAIGLALVAIGRGIHVPGTFVSAASGLLAPLFAVFIAALSLDESPWTRFLAWRPLVLLGEVSYGVYMLQDPTRELVYRIGIGSLSPEALFVAFVVTLVALSAIVWRGFEVPLRALIRTRLRAVPAAGPAHGSGMIPATPARPNA